MELKFLKEEPKIHKEVPRDEKHESVFESRLTSRVEFAKLWLNNVV